ncbi:fungal-specific transcription factor domain-containing protein [Mycena floridula]|nr:fungal-specific transcription factor domain-containing protein [Mycena floridula]
MSGKMKARHAMSCRQCRGRKVKCDASTQAPCSNCIQANTECNFIRKSTPSKSYIQALEKRLAATQALLKQVVSDSGLDAISDSESEASEDEEDDQVHFFAPGNGFAAASPGVGFLGKSSAHFLVRVVVDIKEDLTGRPNIQEKPCLREEFWNPHPWETWPVEEHPIYHFPPDDLMMSLVDLYFRHINLIMPLLHRPTFEKLLARSEHLDRSSKFGTVLSLVLALGSRWSTDTRVLLDDNGSLHSSGWKWYLPIKPVLLSITQRYAQATNLYDIQAICLCSLFTFGNYAPNSTWSMLGVAIRTAQAIGVHRKKPSSEEEHPATSELLRRAWVLVCMDTMLAVALGRTPMIRQEDFDIGMPIDCDDEYWENPDPNLAFKQPPDKPSKISSFICYIRIADLLRSALRKLYCNNDARDMFHSVYPQWEKSNLGHLDSAINHWLQSLPDHLRWNPDHKDPEFFAQSLLLYTSLYHLQILVHRPFLPAPGNEATSSASLAICTNAARSCSHIVDIYYQRTDQIMPLMMGNVFTSGVILMLQLWAGRRAGVNVNLVQRMADVQKCLDALSRCEVRWAVAGQLRDLLASLVASEPQMKLVSDVVTVDNPISLQMDAETDELLRLLLDNGTFVIPPVESTSFYPDRDSASFFLTGSW